MSLFSRTKTPKGSPTPTHAFCEPVTATPTSYWHIREVGEEGLKLGGGIPGVVLCGTERMARGGWDLKSEVTIKSVTESSQPRSGDDRVFVCPACAQIYLATATASD